MKILSKVAVVVLALVGSLMPHSASANHGGSTADWFCFYHAAINTGVCQKDPTPTTTLDAVIDIFWHGCRTNPSACTDQGLYYVANNLLAAADLAVTESEFVVTRSDEFAICLLNSIDPNYRPSVGPITVRDPAIGEVTIPLPSITVGGTNTLMEVGGCYIDHLHGFGPGTPVSNVAGGPVYFVVGTVAGTT